ncbi:hypothetical protein BJ912DRAFT_970421 [Pholiota molesta]|nr:hypothetical protein BJ912DRAFT_970421 [Pholiota molesta]
MLVASRQFLLPLAALLYGIGPVHGGVVTLYYVSQQFPTPTGTPIGTPTTESISVESPGTTIASVIGPGDAGMTRYEIQEIQSKLIVHQPDTTITFFDSPVTHTYTIEQGASTAYQSSPPLITVVQQGSAQVAYVGMNQNCSLDLSKNTGICIGEDQSPSLVDNGDASTSTAIVTSSVTVTGPLLPLATVITSDAKRNAMIMTTGVFLLGATLAIATL